MGAVNANFHSHNGKVMAEAKETCLFIPEVA
jgi:hypothetical protein